MYSAFAPSTAGGLNITSFKITSVSRDCAEAESEKQHTQKSKTVRRLSIGSKAFCLLIAAESNRILVGIAKENDD
jgi:hypothetical protein